MPNNSAAPSADICLISEGAYPYTSGGVSRWMEDLIRAQGHLSFHVVAVVTDREVGVPKYQFPENVTGFSHVYLHDLQPGKKFPQESRQIMQRLTDPLLKIASGGGLADIRAILDILRPYQGQIGREALLNSKAAWDCLVHMYEASLSHLSFLNYFWSWRSLAGGLFAVMTAELPAARVYHTITTGFAGLLAARARIETGRPVMLTEHGIYTNERRIEIMMADWLDEVGDPGFCLEKRGVDLREIWIQTFQSYSRACYEACDTIVTLYRGNQELEKLDGAPVEKLMLVPNGVDFEHWSRAGGQSGVHPPTVALIGRVVPIKDVKTFIHACDFLRRDIPELRALIMGPTEEEPWYYEECRAMCQRLGLNETVTFTGPVRVEEYLWQIDVVALTSLSEAQPLVILEAGAAGIPSVAPDVGSCREMLEGQPYEAPPLGPGGIVTPLAAPVATAQAIKRLLLDGDFRQRCGQAMQQRVNRYYNKIRIDAIYRQLYDELLGIRRPGRDSAAVEIRA